MNTLELTVRKGTGTILGNFLRQLSIASKETYRLAGVRLLGNNSLELNKSENAHQFISRLSDLDFVISDDVGDLFHKETVSFTGQLLLNDLNTSTLKVKYKDNEYNSIRKELNPVILTDPTRSGDTLTLYFRKSRGIHSIEENYDFLEEQLQVLPGTLIALTTNHSDIVNFTFSVEKGHLDTDKLTLRYTTVSGSPSFLEDLVQSGINLLSDLIE